jgi:hypothetical protein
MLPTSSNLPPLLATHFTPVESPMPADRRSPVPRTIAAVLLVVVGAGVTALPGRASLYQPDDPMVVPVRPDGTAEAFPLDQFRIRLAVLGNVANPTFKDRDGRNPDREKVLDRVKRRRAAPNRTADETAALAADLLRLGNSDAGYFADEALGLLIPRTRDRVPNYFVFTTLAQVHAARGEWAEAVTYHDAALLDCEMPAKVTGWTDAQREWVAKLDRDYVPRYYRMHRAEAEARPRPDPEAEEPPPLFPVPQKGKPADPVRFVNDAGAYQPGVLAAGERAKLPPDAVAVVQQLFLWFPADTRLYWLLAELYAADGKLDEAERIMDACVSADRKFGNRKLLVEHRAAVRAAVAARPRSNPPADLIAAPAAPDSTPGPADPAMPISLRTVGIYFGVVVGLAVLAAVRTLLRRGKGGCGPVG